MKLCNGPPVACWSRSWCLGKDTNAHSLTQSTASSLDITTPSTSLHSQTFQLARLAMIWVQRFWITLSKYSFIRGALHRSLAGTHSELLISGTTGPHITRKVGRHR